MSAPAPVTEAHIARARASGFSTDKGLQMAAQFIANNEAAKAERDQLRAELALLREWQREVIQNANAHHAERKDAIARAKLAEAELAEQKYIKRSAVKRANELTEELAAERARLDWLEDNAGDIPKYNSRSFIWSANQNLRYAIDAAMKEETK